MYSGGYVPCARPIFSRSLDSPSGGALKSLEKEIEYYLIRSFKRLGIDLELHILVAIDYRGFVRNT